MGNKKVSLLGFIKLRISFIFILILVVCVFFIGISIYTLNNQYKNRQSVNVLGKQRMYSQIISKDSFKFYIYREGLRTEKDSIARRNLEFEMLQSREQLEEARNQFSTIFTSIKSGRLRIGEEEILLNKNSGDLGALIKEVETKWASVNLNIDRLLNADINEDIQGFIYEINVNNDRILKLSDEITDVVVRLSDNKNFNLVITYSLLGLILIISISVLIFNINRYLVTPLNELYKGIEEIGISSFSSEVKKPTRSELQPVMDEVRGIINKFNKVIELVENINVNKSFTEVLEYIYNNFSNFIPYNHIGIAFIEDEGRSLKAAYAICDEGLNKTLVNMYGYKSEISKTSLGSIIETGETRIIVDLEEYARGRESREHNMLLIESGIRSSITLPLKIKNKPVGIIFFSSTSRNAYNSEHEKFLRTIANSIAICLEKNIFADDLLYSSILALASLAESRDNDTGAHLDRMKEYSKFIAGLLYEDSSYRSQISLEYINDIERFSPLHDIGKVAIRDEILLKPGKLTTEEFETMKTHAIYGAKVLKAAESNIVKSGRSVFKLGIEIAEGHHEKWNGSGYPFGRMGEDIPLSARIVALADVFDALTSIRPYKESFSVDKSLQIIQEGSGSHFDPEIVRVVINNKEKLLMMYNHLNNSPHAEDF